MAIPWLNNPYPGLYKLGRPSLDHHHYNPILPGVPKKCETYGKRLTYHLLLPHIVHCMRIHRSHWDTEDEFCCCNR